jgi:flagellar biosynthesis chaperone FliJ
MSLSGMQRLHSLRALETEYAEAELARLESAKQRYERALFDSQARAREASRELHAALGEGDRERAAAAELVLALTPLEQQRLRSRLVRLEGAVAAARATWHGARVHELQMQALLDTARGRLAHAALLREQKNLDQWFLLSHAAGPRGHGRPDPENAPRNRRRSGQPDGVPRAGGGEE